MERIRYQIEFDVRYGLILNERNGRFYRRLKGLLHGAQLFAAMGGVAVFVGKDPFWAGVSGAVLALVAVLDNQIDPAAKVYALDGRVAAFNALRRQAVDLDDATLDRQLTDLQTQAVNFQLGGLCAVAYRDALQELGHDVSNERLSLWSRLLDLMS
ncbi:hypothetical protein ACTSKR_11430 [Chitinibacteraceae bacterium HSL-7]